MLGEIQALKQRIRDMENSMSSNIDALNNKVSFCITTKAQLIDFMSLPQVSASSDNLEQRFKDLESFKLSSIPSDSSGTEALMGKH